MKKDIFTVFVEKKPNFNLESKGLLKEFKQLLGIENLKEIRVINRYDIDGINEEEYNEIKTNILSETNTDNVYDGNLEIQCKRMFSVEYIPGQYDQRADSAAQCIQIITQKDMPKVKSSKVIALDGNISDEDFAKIKKYYINTVDSREASIEKCTTVEVESEEPKNVQIIEKFIEFDDEELKEFLRDNSLAMNIKDLKLIQKYFREEEHRNPTITEIKVIDTYWSDHCRHTTFQTIVQDVCFEDGKYTEAVKEGFHIYKKYREELYIGKEKPMTLMDIAVIGMKKLKASGQLDDLDLSDEINACSIVVDVEIDGKLEKYLIMFKNETHNHPTEIEPFGGASTCLGGAIRDPLSGRSYVYQAMRVTGSGDPRTSIEKTLKGKLPQRKITKEAARGYSSYGNQIGVATGQVSEIYHEGYVAKRMEVGAVIAAAPYENVIRKTPESGDVIILLGGRTGRDGIGGASGSSKEHSEISLEVCGAEVQKGNAPTERKIQRLFSKKEVTTLIKKCNDFGAGGVSVAIGELAEGININLDLVTKKYEGLDGTEIAISESQERMAVVVEKKHAEQFIKYAEEENLEAVVVAVVTDDKRVTMKWRGKEIVSLSRRFLDTNGAENYTDIEVEEPLEDKNYFNKTKIKYKNAKNYFKNTLKDLNVCSQKGLVEMFDSSIGGNTVLMPFGGKNQSTPSEAMVSKVPVLEGETSTGTIMSYGFNPYISEWSPFHGGLYAVVESVTKIVALGGDYKKIRLSLQEYFEKLGTDKKKWGKPFSALLGALYAEDKFKIPAIGGKDSMSGTFKDLNVPPTIISFGVCTVDVNKVVSQEFKASKSKVVVINSIRDKREIIDFSSLKKNYELVHSLINEDKVLASHTVKSGGIIEAISKMCFGNSIGFKFSDISLEELIEPKYGSIILELKSNVNIEEELKDVQYSILGETLEEYEININGENFLLEELEKDFNNELEDIFPTNYSDDKFKDMKIKNYDSKIKNSVKTPVIKVSKPKVLIPIFPGTNCEYDCERAFVKAGAEVNTLVFNNLTPTHIENSIDELAKQISKSQIIMLPGGFSAGDEPDGSGKFIATIFRNEKIKYEVMNLIKNRDGLMLGICNGFQALIKLGLVTYGEIVDIKEDSPTLTYNAIGRHISCMVNTKIVSNSSPWFSSMNVGEIHSIPVSHGEGRFYANEENIKKLFENNQVATQYVDFKGNPTYDIKFNPNGSCYAIEGITSPDGRVLGKMGHSERVGKNVVKNVMGNHEQKIFESGVNYFK